MENHIEILDNSNDHKYFTQIQNIILDSSGAVDQALYMQIKRLAGKSGVCRASEKYFMSKLDVGRAVFKRSLKFLLDRGWITFKGKEKIMTTGGLQWINTYTVTDIWEENISFFSSKGVSKTTYPNAKNSTQGGSKLTPLECKGVSKTIGGCADFDNPGVSKTTQEEDVFKKIKDAENPNANFSKKENAENQKRLEEVREDLIKKGALSFPRGEVAKQKF